MNPVEMFDEVRIVRSAETEASGHADAVGTVFGVTTPSSTGVDVIGSGDEDCAYNVDFADHLPNAWFAPDLVVFSARPPVELTLGAKSFSRGAAGEWREGPVRPWWKFWN